MRNQTFSLEIILPDNRSLHFSVNKYGASSVPDHLNVICLISGWLTKVLHILGVLKHHTVMCPGGGICHPPCWELAGLCTQESCPSVTESVLFSTISFSFFLLFYRNFFVFWILISQILFSIHPFAISFKRFSQIYVPTHLKHFLNACPIFNFQRTLPVFLVIPFCSFCVALPLYPSMKIGNFCSFGSFSFASGFPKISDPWEFVRI